MLKRKQKESAEEYASRRAGEVESGLAARDKHARKGGARYAAKLARMYEAQAQADAEAIAHADEQAAKLAKRSARLEGLKKSKAKK